MEAELTCPACGNHRFKLIYEVVYEYSYWMDHDMPGLKNGVVFHPYLYDDRVQKSGEQYIECCGCKRRSPCFFQEAEFSAAKVQEILDGPEAW